MFYLNMKLVTHYSHITISDEVAISMTTVKGSAPSTTLALYMKSVPSIFSMPITSTNALSKYETSDSL